MVDGLGLDLGLWSALSLRGMVNGLGLGLRYQCTLNLIIFQKKCFSLFQIDLIAIFHLNKIL